MSDPFESSRLKIARAKEHILDLDLRIAAWVGKNPYKQIIDADPQRPGYHLHKIKLTENLPPSFPALIADTVYNLRAALDHACYALAVSPGKPSPKEAYFPFAGDATKLDAAIRGRCKDIPQNIYPLFRSFKPYKGGNEILWTLNLICTAEKHKIATAMGTGIVRPVTNLSGTGFFESPTTPPGIALNRRSYTSFSDQGRNTITSSASFCL